MTYIKITIRLTIVFLSMLLLQTVSAQKAKTVNTATDVVENSIAAMGGKEFLLSINTLYSNIATEMETRDVNWITKEMLPNKGSFEIVYNDRSVFKNWYDGEVGYEMVDGKPQKADPAEFASKQYRKNIFTELDFLDPTLWTIALAGEEKINGENCYKVNADLVNGEKRILYFSKKTFLMLREDKVSDADKDSFSKVFFSDFKKFGELTYASTLTFGEGRRAQVGKIVSLLINEKVTPEDFK